MPETRQTSFPAYPFTLGGPMFDFFLTYCMNNYYLLFIYYFYQSSFLFFQHFMSHNDLLRTFFGVVRGGAKVTSLQKF